MSVEIATRNVAILEESERIKQALSATHDTAPPGNTDEGIVEAVPVIAPAALTAAVPLSERSKNTARDSRQQIGAIVLGHDDRLFVAVGPCSIHDPEAALEYANWLAEQRAKLGSDLEIVMRAYMEKPRTELGWKGFVYDPRLDGSSDVSLGLIAGRMVTSRITDKGLPVAMERLNASTPPYFNGLVSYDAIGARNTTDQKAREYASGSLSPVGFKNTPDGSIKAAVEAVKASNAPHTYLAMSSHGTPVQVTTKGNPYAHVILRGSEKGPNYTSEYVEQTSELLARKHLPQAIVIDASHGNSSKNPKNHGEVIASVACQVATGQFAIKGVMLESNLVSGNQPLEAGKELVYGQSITDGCSGLEDTEAMLHELAEAVRTRRGNATR